MVLTLEQRREALRKVKDSNAPIQALGDAFTAEQKEIYLVLKPEATENKAENIQGIWFEPGVPKRVDGLDANWILTPTSDLNIELKVYEFFELYAYNGLRTKPNLVLRDSKDGSKYMDIEYLVKDGKEIPFNPEELNKKAVTGQSAEAGQKLEEMNFNQLSKIYNEKFGKSPVGMSKDKLLQALQEAQ